jgi:hypothetical protein
MQAIDAVWVVVDESRTASAASYGSPSPFQARDAGDSEAINGHLCEILVAQLIGGRTSESPKRLVVGHLGIEHPHCADSE